MKCPQCQIENPSDSKYCKECATPLPSSEEIILTATKTLETPMRELESGTTFARKYQILEDIGKGGMGIVYKALDKEVSEHVAVKILKPEIAQDIRIIERFRNELKIARKISHKNICRMYDLNKEEGTYYITMEYVPGEDLKDVIRREEKLSSEKALGIAKQVGEGLVEAHRLGVVHRDLKPNNIMIDKEGNAKIMDFGIARSVEAPGVTQTGMMIGTPDYMSPEQAEGEEADQRSDIYALGIILYEMMTGRVPFKGDTAFSVALKHKSQLPKDPKKLNPEISEELSRLILVCMEKDRERRYQTAEALLSDLRNMEEGFPLGTEIKPRRETFGASLLRKKLFIPVLVAALAVIAVVLWQFLPQKAPAPLPSDRPSLAIVYFENPSGDESLEGWKIMLAELMTADLMQSKFIDVLSGDRVFSSLKKLNLLDVKKYATEDLIRFADEARVNHTVSGSLIRAGDEILITAHLQKPHTGEVINSRKITCRNEADINPHVDELTRLIKSDLNLSQEQITSDLDEEVGKITTNSPEAYGYYTEGKTFHLNGEYQKSIPLMEKAVEIDPEFAMAYRYLSASHRGLRNYRENMMYLEKALELTDRLSERERLIIQIYYDNYKSPGKYTKEHQETLEKLVELYPEDLYGNLYIAHLYANLEELDKAIEHLELLREKEGIKAYIYTRLASYYRNKGLYDKAEEIIKELLDEFPEEFTAHRNLAVTYMHSRKYDLALAELDKAFSLNPKNFGVPLQRGDIYLLRGDFKRAEAEYMSVVEGSKTGISATGVQKLVHLYLLQGRFKECEALFERGRSMIDQVGGGRQWEFVFYNGLAFFHMSIGRFEKALEENEKVWEISVELDDIGKQRMTLLNRGLAYLKMNMIDKALEDAAQLKILIEEGMNKKLMRFYYHLVGMIELEEKNFPKGIDCLQEAISLQTVGSDARIINSMASAYYRSGDLDKAYKEYEKITNLTTNRLGRGVLYAKSYYMLSKICEEKGWEGKAIEHYEKFLDLWKDADPGIAEVEDARERLAALRDN